MIVYRDIISGDEMLSDAFKLEDVIDSEGNKVCKYLRHSDSAVTYFNYFSFASG